MKYYLLIIWFSCFHLLECVGQSSSKEAEKTNIDKWNHAIVNLETRSYSNKEMSTCWERLIRKEINFIEYGRLADSIHKSEHIYTGTAIFFTYKGHYFLLTARHVLENDFEDEDKHATAQTILLIENGTPILKTGGLPASLITFPLHALFSGTNYIFSSREDDLAVLFLSNYQHISFLSSILQRGYVPISIDDIDVECKLTRSQEIMSFGYPGDVSMFKRDMNPRLKTFESDLISIPVVSEGIIIDPLPNTNFFTGGIFVYHGNSGGPIVSHNKLIGIVSRQDTPFKETNGSSLSYYKTRDLYFIKSSAIMTLINETYKMTDKEDDLIKATHGDRSK